MSEDRKNFLNHLAVEAGKAYFVGKKGPELFKAGRGSIADRPADLVGLVGKVEKLEGTVTGLCWAFAITNMALIAHFIFG